MIRPLQKNDLPAVYDIYCWYIKNSTANLGWLNPIREDFYLEQLGIAWDYPYYVAEHEGEIIGFGYLHKYMRKEAYQFDAELTIYFKQGNHHGLPGMLYEQIEKKAKELGYVRLICCTTASNQPSLDFQKRYGFKIYGTLENAGFKGGEWHTVVWSTKVIGPFEDRPERVRLLDRTGSVKKIQ